MLHFTAFEASFNGSQQQFPLFAHFSGSPGWERQRWKNVWWDPAPCQGPMLTKPSFGQLGTPKTSTNRGSLVPLAFSQHAAPSLLEKRVPKAVRARRGLGTPIACFRGRKSFSWSLRKANFLVVPPLPVAYTMQGKPPPELLHETKDGCYTLRARQKTPL